MASVASAYPLPTDNNDAGTEPSSKRQRHDNDEANNVVALYAPPLEEDDEANNNIRTSSLEKPTMKLSGHKGSVYCLAYDPLGEVLCSGSFDSTCLLWKGEFVDFLYVGVCVHHIIIHDLFIPALYLLNSLCTNFIHYLA